MNESHATADKIIYVCISALMILGLLSFFVAPSYEKGAWLVLTMLTNGLSGALSFKYGITNGDKAAPAGTVSQGTTQTTVQEAPKEQ